MAAADYVTVVQQLYVAYFGRPADTKGLSDFCAALDAAKVPATIAGVEAAYRTSAAVKTVVDSFSTAPESVSLYGNVSPEDFVMSVYQNVLNRAPDTKGYEFWVDALKKGFVTTANASLSIMAAAKVNTTAQGLIDAKTVDAKIAVATNFTTAITTLNATFSGDAAAAAARELLATVVSTTDVTTFQSKIEACLTNAGSTFTLTTASDVPSLTAKNDTINATNLTLLTGDVVVDGQATDNDTLNIALTAAPATQATIANIENINYNVTSFADVTLSATGITGAKTFTINNLQLAGTAGATLNNVATGATVKAGSGVTGTLAVGQDAASSVTVLGGTAATVNVTGGTTGATVITGGTDTTSASGVATTGSVYITGEALTSGTATGATTTVKLDKVGTTASPTTVAVTGTAGTTDVANVYANGVVTLTNNANIETVNLYGKTEAVTYTAAAAFTKLNLNGDQNVTVKGNESFFDGKTVTDGTSGKTTTVVLTNTAASNSDLTKVAVDVIEQNGALLGGVTYNLADNATLDVTAAQTQVITLATAGTSATTAVTTDVINVNAKNAATVLITSDSTTAASETAFNTVNFSVATANTTLTAVLGADTGTLNLSGNKQVTLATTSTAKKVNAANLTGALIATASATTTADIVGGSGNDVITTATGAAVKLNGGAGSNTVKVVGDMSGVEFTNFAVVEATGNITAAKTSQFDGKAFVLTGGAGTTFTFGTTAANFDTTTVDVSKLVTNNITGFTIDATNGLSTALFTSKTGITITGSDLADTLTGTANADVINGGKGGDTISGGAGADTLNGGDGADGIEGGAGVDTISGGEGADEIAGGDGADIISLAETTAAADVIVFTAATEYGDTVTGFAAGAGADSIEFAKALAGSADTTFTTAAASITDTTITKAAVTTGTTEGALVSAAVNAGATNKAAAADLSNLTKIAAVLGDTVAVADGVAGAAETLLFIVEASDSTTDAASFGVYSWTQGANTDTTIGATELKLVGVFSGTGAVAAADFTLV